MLGAELFGSAVGNVYLPHDNARVIESLVDGFERL
jgi:hypothetical protein